MLEEEINMVVSSAYITHLAILHTEKMSLTYKIYKIGPKLEPYGTPAVIRCNKKEEYHFSFSFSWFFYQSF